MATTLLQSDLQHQTQSLMAQVYPGAGAWFNSAANTLFSGLIHGGDTLVNRLAAFVNETQTSPKGLCERISGWLNNFDFATPAAAWLLARNAPRVLADTTIAVDLSDISKPWGGKGMEGMSMGRDGSRGTLAMGHTFCAAVAVAPARQHVFPLAFAFEMGRKGENKRLRDTLRATHEATAAKGFYALDRGADSEGTLAFLQTLAVRAVVRVKYLTRDVFGTGRAIDAQLDDEPRVDTRLFKPNGSVCAKVSWRVGHLGGPHDAPVLLVRSEFDGRALYLYALPGKEGAKALEEGAKDFAANARHLALTAAQAYLDRWQVETFFERVKQDFSLENARVRTFKRLKNLFYLCVLGYSFLTDVLPSSPAHTRMVKVFKDNLHRVTFRTRAFLSGLRVLLAQPRLNFITGRPRRRVFTPDDQLLLTL